jgi:hemerythrin
MFIEWNTDYSVQIISIDTQHKKLFDLINLLHEKIQKNEAKKLIEPILIELEDYTQTHFKTEEDMMQKTKYPKIQEHFQAHAFFIQKLQEIKQQFNEKLQVSTIPIEVWVFLRSWLTEHILKMDQEYKSHFKNNGIR